MCGLYKNSEKESKVTIQKEQQQIEPRLDNTQREHTSAIQQEHERQEIEPRPAETINQNSRDHQRYGTPPPTLDWPKRLEQEEIELGSAQPINTKSGIASPPTLDQPYGPTTYALEDSNVNDDSQKGKILQPLPMPTKQFTCSRAILVTTRNGLMIAFV